ncbi:UDP-N-acetylglucosamine 2-epimerase [Paenibacillus sp. Z6-24]
MIKILVITGTRADYGIYYPILKAIEQTENMELNLLVTGMHLSPQYGYTIDHIRKDGFTIAAQVDCLLQGSTHANMAKSVGLALMGMTQAFEMIMPDRVLILGDRGEMLAAAIAASHMNIPLFHLHGGEVSGTIDESVRHAISKLAHIHLAATEGSRQRLLRMGEDDWRIHVVGAPRIETMINTVLPELNEVKHRYGLDAVQEYIIFIYHPVTTEQADQLELARMLKVLLNTGKDIVCVMPNADAGTETIMQVYEPMLVHSNFHPITSFRQLDYLTMLKGAAVLAGNSSSGIIEAASFHIPVINIGSRQGARERSANVIDIAARADDLSQALSKALSNPFRELVRSEKNVYEQPGTSDRIVKCLQTYGKSEKLIQKVITY